MKKRSMTKALLRLHVLTLLMLFVSLSAKAFTVDSRISYFLECNTSPVITCPQNYFGCPGDDMSPDITGYATAVPGEVGCDEPVVSYADLIISEGPCTGQILVKRIWSAEYPNNSNPWLFAECTQIILLEDVVDPIIEDCPADITVNMNTSCDNPTWNEPYTVENCQMQSFTANFSSGDEFPEGTTTVIYTAIDACGNDSQCEFTVTVIGQCCENAPIITCPSNVNLCPDEDISPDINGYPVVNVNESCGPYSLTYNDNTLNNDFDCTGHPVVRRTWTVVYDNHPELSASCLQRLIYKDNQAPQFTFCPDDIIVDNEGDCTGEANWDLPTATDNCGIQFLSSNFEPGDEFPEGETIVTYSAVDNCGNVSVCSFSVMVVNNCCSEPAEITCPSTYTICPGGNIDPDVSGYPVILPDPNCGPVWISHEDIVTSDDAGCSGYPKINRIWTVKYEDSGTLMATCTQVINFSDSTLPTFSNCPNNMTFSTPEDVFWIAPTVSDNCGISSLIANYNPNSTFPIGATEVIYTALDECGNIATCSFNVTVEGNGLILECPDDITLSCGGELEDWQYSPTYTTTCSACDYNNQIDGFIYMGTLKGHKYYCSSFASTWDYANSYCISYGGHLASINSAEENTMLANFLTTQSAYIGFSDSDNEGQFKWSNGDPVTYTNWYPGQPNNYLAGQDHVELLNNGQWNDQYPYKKLEFIMEIPCVNITQTGGPDISGYIPEGAYEITYSANDACGNFATCSFNVTVESSLDIECPDDVTINCPYGSNGIVVNWNTPEVNTCCTTGYGGPLDGWIWMGEYNGSNYYCTLEPYTWDEGNTLCHSYGGYLATINDSGENAFLANILATQSAYIGLIDVQHEGNFMWETGESMTYTNWYPGQPNNFNGIQDHVEMLSNGQWNDQYYYKKLECIMEIPGSANITQIQGPPSGSVFSKGSTTTIAYQVTDGCGNSEICSFDITVEGEECIPTGLNSSSCWIQTVLIDDFINDTGNNQGYGDFTNSCVDMFAGNSYNLKLKPSCSNSTSKNYWSIYIDFNKDGDFFDNGEFVAYGSSSSSISGVLSLPYNIWNGDVTMRILMHRGSYANGPCDSNGFGEIEDYCIQVLGANGIQDQDNVTSENRSKTNNPVEFFGTPVDINVYPNPATDVIFIENDKSTIDRIELYSVQGKLMKSYKGKNVGNGIDVSDQPSGAYFIKIFTNIDKEPFTKRIIINNI